MTSEFYLLIRKIINKEIDSIITYYDILRE